MFNGIIQEIGVIKQISRIRGNIILTIIAKNIVKDLKIGSSISIDGVCQTIISIHNCLFQVEVIKETQRSTTLRYLKINDIINLEAPTKMGEDISGHLITGHIEGVGKILDFSQEQSSKILLVSLSKDLMKYVVRKGSIAIDGISLTITDVIENNIKTAIISHTYENTVLKNKRINSLVNIETDIMAKYVYKALSANKSSNINRSILSQNGFI